MGKKKTDKLSLKSFVLQIIMQLKGKSKAQTGKKIAKYIPNKEASNLECIIMLYNTIIRRQTTW